MQIKTICPHCKKERLKSLFYFPYGIRNQKSIDNVKYCPICNIIYKVKVNLTKIEVRDIKKENE